MALLDFQDYFSGYAKDWRLHAPGGYYYIMGRKLEMVNKDICFLNLVRYIYLIPVVAGMVEDIDALRKHLWIGHADVLNKFKKDWYKAQATLASFGPTLPRARSVYVRFMKGGARHVMMAPISQAEV